MAVSQPTPALRIVVTGLICQHPPLGGLAWHYLHFLLGLVRLGHDVYYFEDSGEVPYLVDSGTSAKNRVAASGQNVDYLARLMARFDLDDRWAYRYPPGAEWFGLSAERRRAVIRSADLLLNISGSLEYPEKYRPIPRLVYIDTDPVVTQAKIATAEDGPVRRRADAHDVHFSFGERLWATMPGTRHRWRPTRQPIVLSEWPPSGGAREVFTTVMSWTSYAPARYGSDSYGQKDVEFKRFLELPQKVDPLAMEVALGSTRHQDWETEDQSTPRRASARENERWTPRDLLGNAGWNVVDAFERCGDPDRYRWYIQSSRAEWTVAKHAYVRGRPGWFSERSACYLASGRPVVVQDTGFAGVLPAGEGILAFQTLDEAVDAVREVDSDYARHSQAARSIAEEFFDSDRVLPRLLEEAMGGAGQLPDASSCDGQPPTAFPGN